MQIFQDRLYSSLSDKCRTYIVNAMKFMVALILIRYKREIRDVLKVMITEETHEPLEKCS